MATIGIVMAAGKGTRMKSDLPKALHSVCGRPMLGYVLKALEGAGAAPCIIVVGHKEELVRSAFGDQYFYARQEQQLGTGDAARQAVPHLPESGTVLIAPGDAPLITSEAIQEMLGKHRTENASLTLAAVTLENPTGYGRVVQEPGRLRIVEEKDATPEERQITHCAASFYAVEASALRVGLSKLSDDNAAREFYLTDIVAILSQMGEKVVTWDCRHPELLMGVNDRWELAQATKTLYRRIAKRHAINGATIIDPDTAYIEDDIEIGADTVIYPNSHLRQGVRIGARCEIGPDVVIAKARIGDDCRVQRSNVIDSELESDVWVGPFSNVRPGCLLKSGSRIGAFVEVNRSVIGRGAKAVHLAYLGDAILGEGVNIGAGTITCNFDGKHKNQTHIGDDAFVGSNSTLIAPVNIAPNSYIAAGSAITDDVPEGALGIGRGRQVNKEGWVEKRNRSDE